jgi:hypothetical protein
VCFEQSVEALDRVLDAVARPTLDQFASLDVANHRDRAKSLLGF